MMSPSSSIAFSARRSRAGWLSGTSKTAVTCPCTAPWRTSEASPRAPRASDNASSRIDLPAPVSPVRTDSPGAKSISRRSIRTISRIESLDSIGDAIARRCQPAPCARSGSNDELAGLGYPGPLVLSRLQSLALQELVGCLVPPGNGIVVAEHGGRRVLLGGQPYRRVGFR